ncbi:hypothetical protein TIFTF001_029208 [Ficus carica]|uniref:Uncharacterized protein n=1 Tax=Ficus carica TaxID=3494 RepID=A0AA88J193_FICCA|nr:hypothetical protein TIFTF001_029208 [Ficus carica]
MSDLFSDSENDNLFVEVDIIGSSKSTGSYESTTTLDNLSRISDIPTPRGGSASSGYSREGIQWLRQILELGLTTFPDHSFMNELSNVRVPEQPRTRTGFQVVNLIGEEDAAVMRIARQPSTFGRGEDSDKESESSGSATPQAILCTRWTTSLRRSPPDHLESLKEEFQIPGDIELVVPGPNDLLSRLPPDQVTLSTEFFQAGLRLPFHPFLRTSLESSNRDRIEKLWEKTDPELNQNPLLANEKDEAVTIAAPMPNLAVHYRARTVVVTDGVATSVGRSKVLGGLPTLQHLVYSLAVGI